MNIVFGFIILLGIIGLVSWFFTVYNGLVQVRENIKKSWANIDVLLMQRSDEIPKLIKTVKAFATHEKEMFDSVMAAREKYLGASSVPDVWIAGPMGLQQEEMFEVPVEKKEDVDIDLDDLYGDKGSDQQ